MREYTSPQTDPTASSSSKRQRANRIHEMNFTIALVCVVAVMLLFCGRCKGAPGLITSVHRNLEKHPHIHGYAVEGLVKDLVEDLVGEDEEILRLSKRQHLDDYGHLRFGKRTNGDDEEYGHSRFGRNIE